MEINEILQQCKNDPTLKISDQELEQWIEEISDKSYHYLDGKTPSIIKREKEEALKDYPIELREKWLDSLSMYRIIHDLQDFRYPRHTRWITWDKKTISDEQSSLLKNYPMIQGNLLHRGAILMKYLFSDKGVKLLMNFNFNKKRPFSVSMDATTLFQRISPEEWIVIMANDNIEKTEI
jgi:hypothetical protein